MPYYHVDVFSSRPFAGNGLIVFPEAGGLSTEDMQVLTQEMRQYESIFLTSIGGDGDGEGTGSTAGGHGIGDGAGIAGRHDSEGTAVHARIFTCTEELAFAGHPVLGAAATLHDLLRPSDQQAGWVFQLKEKTVAVTTDKKEYGYDGIMNQGQATFGRVLDAIETKELLSLIGATPADLYPGFYPTVVTTGLSYLIVPLYDNKFRARIGAPGVEEKLQAAGARFIGLLDIAASGGKGEDLILSIRTGDNDGSVEDIATGSLAGPAGAFLVKHGLVPSDNMMEIRQGKNLGRDSRLYVELVSRPDGTKDVMVKGSVCKIARGVMEV